MKLHSKSLKLNISWFTLVEVLVAITVIAILTTIGFFSYISSTTKARNSVRTKDLADITDAINLYKTQNTTLPDPDWDTSTWVINGKLVVIEWIFWDRVSTVFNLKNLLTDPLNNTNYIYSKSYDNLYFQVAATLEKENKYSYFWDTTYAANSASYSARVTWNYLWYIKYSTWWLTYLANLPSLIYNYSWTTNEVNDLFSSWVYFVIDNGANLPYQLKDNMKINNASTDSVITSITKSDSVTLTWVDVTDIIKSKKSISQIFNTSTISSFWYSKDVVKKVLWDSDILSDTTIDEIKQCDWVWDWITVPLSCGNWNPYPKSCNDILTNTWISFSWSNTPTAVTYSWTSSTKFKNWIYLIDPDGTWTGTSTTVYCDMNDDNWWWTYLINPYSYSTWTSLWLNLTYTAGNGWTCLNNWVIVNPSWPSNYYMYVIYRCAWDSVNSTMSWSNVLWATKLRMVVNAFWVGSYIKLNWVDTTNPSLSAWYNVFAAESWSCSLNACRWSNWWTWRTDVKPRIYNISWDFIVTAWGTWDGNRWWWWAVYTNVAVK